MTKDEVKALREQAKMSLQELADYLGLKDRSQARHLESGRTAVSGAKLRMLEMLREKIAKEARQK